jgi:hypothetical protein
MRPDRLTRQVVSILTKEPALSSPRLPRAGGQGRTEIPLTRLSQWHDPSMVEDLFKQVGECAGHRIDLQLSGFEYTPMFPGRIASLVARRGDWASGSRSSDSHRGPSQPAPAAGRGERTTPGGLEEDEMVPARLGSEHPRPTAVGSSATSLGTVHTLGRGR